MTPHLAFLAFLAVLARQNRGAHWTRGEIHRLLTTIRGQSKLAERVIPAGLEQLTHSEVDDVITGVWILTARVEVGYDRLLELDALGAALDLTGCVTRVGFHVRDAVQIPSDPWDGTGSLTLQ